MNNCQSQVLFAGMLEKIVLFRPPRLLSVMWRIVRIVLSEQSMQLVDMVQKPSQLLQCYPAECVLESAGGTATDLVCQPARTPITADRYYQPGKVWREYGAHERIDEHRRTINIKPGKTHTLPLTAQPDHTQLLWHLQSTSELLFSIVYIADQNQNEQGTAVFPKQYLYSQKLPEEGVIECQPGVYHIEIYNGNLCFNANVDFSYLLLKENQ